MAPYVVGSSPIIRLCNNIESEIWMLLYRYEFVKDDYRIGFLTGLDDFFNDEK